MVPPERDRYTLEELAELWGWNANDIKSEVRRKRIVLTEELNFNSTTKSATICHYVTNQERRRYEIENGIKGNQTANTSTPYLDSNHKYYSKELAVSVKVWLALYGEGGEYKPRQSHKDQITKLLDGNGFTHAAIKRIATLVNPNKVGGAPSCDT